MVKRGYRNFLIFFSVLILISSFVIGGDVAYIYRNPSLIDHNVIDVFEDMGLDVDLIQENMMPDEWNYKLLYMGDEVFAMPEEIPVGRIPSIVTNYFYGQLLGITDGDGISKLSANSPLKVNKDRRAIRVYTKAWDKKRRTGVSYYYIGNNNKVCQIAEKVAGTYTGSLDVDLGDVIAYINHGTVLGNEMMTEGNICFFGLVASNFWTPAARNMFKNCAEFVISGSEEGPVPPGPEPVPEPSPPEPIPMPDRHDVGFVNFSNAVNMIRLEHTNGTDILGNELMCNEKYIIGVTIMNKGNFSENVTFNGSIDGLAFQHNAINEFGPANKSLKTKTVNFTLTQGDYNIRVEAVILHDDNHSDNVVTRRISVICPLT